MVNELRCDIRSGLKTYRSCWIGWLSVFDLHSFSLCEDLSVTLLAIGSAFAVLSDPVKRKRYDQFGTETEQVHTSHHRSHRGSYYEYDYTRGFEGRAIVVSYGSMITLCVSAARQPDFREWPETTPDICSGWIVWCSTISGFVKILFDVIERRGGNQKCDETTEY